MDGVDTLNKQGGKCSTAAAWLYRSVGSDMVMDLKIISLEPGRAVESQAVWRLMNVQEVNEARYTNRGRSNAEADPPNLQVSQDMPVLFGPHKNESGIEVYTNEARLDQFAQTNF